MIQYVLDLKIPFANAQLASLFQGNYVYLSKQKVGSNVVEKCLKVFPDDDKAAIIWELISASHFEQLLQDPYANYVIHTALVQTRVSTSSFEFDSAICSTSSNLTVLDRAISAALLLTQSSPMRKLFGPIPVVRESLKSSLGGKKEMGCVQSVVPRRLQVNA